MMAVIDAYGGDARRWPADERAALQQLAEAHPEVRTHLVRARALDRVLAAAATPPEGLEPLKERIMAAVAAGGGRAIAVPAVQAVAPLRRAVGPGARLRHSWPVAAALAASLIVGVVLGRSELASPAVEGLVETAGLEVANDSGLDFLAGADEELL
jgi:hypothetical protein